MMKVEVFKLAAMRRNALASYDHVDVIRTRSSLPETFLLLQKSLILLTIFFSS
jgi:hypothetical protein